MKDLVIITGVRTPIGNYGGALKDVPAQKLGELAVREVIAKIGIDPTVIEEVIIGCVGQPSDAYNIARVIALQAGLPIKTPAYTVQRNCSSGLQPFVNASQNLQSQDADVQIVGGVEKMSRAPYLSGHALGQAAAACRIHRQYLGGIDGPSLRPAHGTDSGNVGGGVWNQSSGTGPVCGGKSSPRV